MYKLIIIMLALAMCGCKQPSQIGDEEASSRHEAFLQIVQDAILKGLVIESITFCGQYTKMPNNSKSIF